MKKVDPIPTVTDCLRQLMATTLTVAILAAPVSAMAASQTDSSDRDAVQIRSGISIGVKGDQIIPSLSLRDAEIRDVLYTLSDQANFNLIVDDSVDGTLSLDLKNISINKLLEYVMTLSDLTYYKDGSTVIITSNEKADKQALNKIVLKSVPVKYSNAKDLVDVLNKTVFSVNRPGGNSKALATADPRTNSILIMGNEVDISLANRALAELDFPLQHKTFFLKNASASDVANTISQTLFSVSLTAAAGGAAGGAPAAGAAAPAAGGAAGGGGASGTGAPIGTGIQVLKGGPVTFIANAVNNTLTLIGTAEQIELAEAMMYDVDVKPAQVAIQVSVIELSETRAKSLNTSFNQTASGNGSVSAGIAGLNYVKSSTTDDVQSIFDISRRGGLGKLFFDSARFQALLTESKGKVLANPTVMAVSGTSSTINVTNDVFGGQQVTQTSLGQQVTSPIIKSVGISLNITPQVANDGTVTLQLAPTVSSLAGTGPNGIALTSQDTLTIAQARVRDGETLILGGIIREDNSSGVSKVPFLADIPVIGGLFRPVQTNNKARKELVILVTPHIVREDGVPYFRKEWRNNLSYTESNSRDASPIAKVMPVDNGIIPTSNRGPLPRGEKTLQTLERRQYTNSGRDQQVLPNRSSNTSLPTFGEVLK